MSEAIAAGALSGIAADVLTHPLSTVKARLQGASSAGVAQYRGITDCFATVVRSEGAFALWKGLGAVVVGAAPAQALYFMGFEQCKAHLPQGNPAASFASGFIAQLCGSVIWVPMDVVKERLQIEGQMGSQIADKYGNATTALRKIVAREGVSGLYRAYWIHQWTWAPFNGLYFTIYDATTPHVHEAAAGVVAGVVAAAATNPMDLVKTRLQIARSRPDVYGYTGVFDCARKIVAKEGPRALFDGTAARCLTLTPRLYIAVQTYEYCKAAFGSR